MKALNTVKITFPSRSVNEGFARSALSAFAAQADPTLDELADVKTAVSEAVTNCIVHAYANTIGPITLTAALYEDGTLRVAVADKGCGIAGCLQGNGAAVHYGRRRTRGPGLCGDGKLYGLRQGALCPGQRHARYAEQAPGHSLSRSLYILYRE